MEATGKIAGIFRHRLNDGQGITTLVGLQGCPLCCRYCLNPKARSCKEYVSMTKTIDDLCEEVKVDDLYFQATGGGITFGGGEPLLQSQFIEDFRWACHLNWRLTVETSLNVPLNNVAKILPHIDELIVDVKDMNPNIYKRYTGQDNKQVIENLKWLVEQGAASRTLIRVPLIPGFNTLRDVNKSLGQLEKMGFWRFDRLTYKMM